MTDPTNKYKKIKNNIKGMKDDDEQMLVYKDHSDDEDAFNKIEEQAESEEGEYESEEDDEVIEQIQIGKKKKQDDEYDDEYDDEMALDDSVSSD